MTTSWDREPRRVRQPGTVTVGVAVAVPAPFADALQACRRAVGDPLADAVPPHITLVPPLTVPDDALAGIRAHLQARVAEQRAFRLRLRGTDSFRPVSDVVFVSVAEGGRHCEHLQQLLRDGPLERELQFPYHPHVTVAHDVPQPELDAAQQQLAQFTADFPVDHVSLYRCGDDGVWVPELEFPLATGPMP